MINLLNLHRHHQLAPWIGFAGVILILQGMLALAQISNEQDANSPWRRTRIGWEQAESLPVANAATTAESVSFSPLALDTATLQTAHTAHRMFLPLAIAGFIACLGPWCLLRWPTDDLKSESVN